MANTGFITSSGIQQVFTTGPFSGSVVSSSYISGGIVFGPTTDFNESFISGSEDILSPCTTIFQRYYQDLIACPINGCTPPSIIKALCLPDPYNYEYQVLYNSGSSNATYTIIEYSVSSLFTNTGSHIQDNSLPYSTVINVDDLELLPTAYTTVYFRAYNSCSDGSKSEKSLNRSTSCIPPVSTLPTLTFNTIGAATQGEQWKIYTIAGAPGTRIDYSTSLLLAGNHDGTITMEDTSGNYALRALSFTNPRSGYYIIPSSGKIELLITYSAYPTRYPPSPNCVGLTLTFAYLVEDNSALLPAGPINIEICDSDFIFEV
jgi:hypothetical protein